MYVCVCVCVCVCSSIGFCSSITLYVRAYGSHILHLFLKYDLRLTNTVTETSTCARRLTYDVIRTSFSRVGKKVAGRLPEWQMWSSSGSRHFIRCRSWRWVCESVIGSVRVVHVWHLAWVRWRSVLGPGGMDRWLACLLGRMGREGWWGWGVAVVVAGGGRVGRLAESARPEPNGQNS